VICSLLVVYSLSLKLVYFQGQLLFTTNWFGHTAYFKMLELEGCVLQRIGQIISIKNKKWSNNFTFQTLKKQWLSWANVEKHQWNFALWYIGIIDTFIYFSMRRHQSSSTIDRIMRMAMFKQPKQPNSEKLNYSISMKSMHQPTCDWFVFNNRWIEVKFKKPSFHHN